LHGRGTDLHLDPAFGRDAKLFGFFAHEGSHVVDDLKLISNGYNKKGNITHLESEQRAYSLENRVLETEVMRTNPDWQSKKAIQKFLLTKPDLYPTLGNPILEPKAIPEMKKR